ncbi:MAG: FAD-dependent oxidoreductase, partial [Pararhodobacter sp.]|nr:FAD-dependent oxidoreductase [Pararhodobacter sp.]
NRMAFPLAVLKACRDRVGEDFILGIRYVADERLPGGVEPAEGIEIGRRFKASGMVDFLNIIRGHIDTDPGLTDVIPIQGMPSAPHLDFAGEVRKSVDVPIFHAARIPDVATARHAIAAGKVDMIGMTRAHLTEPHLVRRIIDKTEDRIRPCVGANYCLDRIYQGGLAFCIHNAASGREETLPQDIPAASARKRVVIVGAGPGGLEAARVAAARGHDVTVFEAAAQPGGQIRLTAQSHRKKEMMGIIDWRMAECSTMGVNFRFNTLAEAEDVTALSPDIVIIATGGLPFTEVLTEGNDLVISTWDILSGAAKPGSNVLVYDDAGDHAGMQAAEWIAERGARVEIMTPDRSFAPEVMAMNLTPYIRAMQDKDVTFTVTWRLKSVHRDGNELRAVIGTDYSNTTRERRFDQIVVNHGTRPLDDLYFDLKPLSSNLGALDHDALIAQQPQTLDTNPDGAFQLWRIGDAVASRNTHAAILDALRLMAVH